jgi:hypothetical protein
LHPNFAIFFTVAEAMLKKITLLWYRSQTFRLKTTTQDEFNTILCNK